MPTTTCSLHPLLILTISDHHARIKLGGSSLPSTSPAYGIIFGTFLNGEVLCVDGQECVCNAKGEIDVESVKIQVELIKAVFPDREIVGWYKSGEEVRKEDMLQHEIMINQFSLQLFLLYTPSTSTLSPHTFLLSSRTFLLLPPTLTTTASEKVALESVSKLQVSNSSVKLKTCEDLETGLKGMDERLTVISEYLEGVENGKISKNPEIKELVNLLLQQFQIKSKNPTSEVEKDLVKVLAGLCEGVNGFGRMGEAFGKVEGEGGKWSV